MLLAGIGHVNAQNKKNFLIVDSSISYLFGIWHEVDIVFLETQVSTIEAAFQEYTEREDIAILLINQHVCRFLFTLD